LLFKSVNPARDHGGALLAGGEGEGVGEEWWMERWFVHGGGGGGQLELRLVEQFALWGVRLLYSATRWDGVSEAGQRRLKWREEAGWCD
jgi:hypothetical protein